MTTADERLDALHAEIRAHHGTGCGFEVCETCTQLVPGEGRRRPRRWSSSARRPAPRRTQPGRPFVGAAGKLLDGLLAEAGLARDDVYITNVVKARPPGNRDPKAAEVAHHWPWLEAQLAIIRPALLVPLGRHALARFAPEAKIAEVHGTVIEADGRRLFPLYHPAAALHNPGAARRRWSRTPGPWAAR